MRERLGLDNGSAPALFPRRAPPQPPAGAADAAPPVPRVVLCSPVILVATR
jgi:hypothetical protein